VQQCQGAITAALADGVLLQEVQFPPAGLESVPGDAEGNFESNQVLKHLRNIARLWQTADMQERLRVFFPDESELALATARVSDGTVSPAGQPAPFAEFAGRCTYLCEEGLLTTSGLSKLLGWHVPASARTAPDDVAYLVSQPSLNIDEMVQVAELERNAGRPRRTPIITVNAELERIRTSYYPPFWARAELDELRVLAPRFEAVYFLHNFKRSSGPSAVLFRAYPGPFQVLLREQDGSTRVVHTQPSYPGLKAVATEIVPRALAARRK